jgi:3-deoxy-D-manno-octulosonic-acid transferase
MHKNSVPVLMVNGRISDKSFGGYKWVKPFIGSVLRKIDFFSMQTDSDAERIIYLGAPQEKVQVTGNLKFDQEITVGAKKESLRKNLGLPPSHQLMVAGSTHSGEDEIVLEVYRNLHKRFPSLSLLIAPRHPERTAKVKTLVKKAGFIPVKKTTLAQTPTDHSVSDEPPTVIILDTVGELCGIYGLADIVFVGGSLVPKGGQNPLEPAALGKPVLFGTHMDNFKEIVEILKQTGGGIEVRDKNDFKQAAAKLLDDPQTSERLGLAAKKAVEKNRGAVEKNIAVIEKYLESE